MLSVVNIDDPRVRRTQRELEQALLGLLKQQSLSEVTVRAIADRAGINRATFYAHFVDKYALFGQLICTLFQEALGRDVPETAALSRANLLALTRAVMRFMEPLSSSWCITGTHQEVRPLLESQVQKQLYRRILSWLSPLSIGQTDAELAATAISWTLFGVGLQWTSPAHQDTQEVVAQKAVDFIVAGLEQSLAVRLS